MTQQRGWEDSMAAAFAIQLPVQEMAQKCQIVSGHVRFTCGIFFPRRKLRQELIILESLNATSGS